MLTKVTRQESEMIVKEARLLCTRSAPQATALEPGPILRQAAGSPWPLEVAWGVLRTVLRVLPLFALFSLRPLGLHKWSWARLLKDSRCHWSRRVSRRNRFNSGQIHADQSDKTRVGDDCEGSTPSLPEVFLFEFSCVFFDACDLQECIAREPSPELTRT